ncbi:hypothetical protein I6I99_00615 [Sphingobacterium multivorum]|nr:hypothetical protein [Sphingobacterium multivorum]QQT31112.1 hypothetical protein I6I99_00615 [Sphingobacterium multivorum]
MIQRNYNRIFRATLATIFTLILFSNCKIFQGPDLTKIQVGMTKAQVIQKLGKPDAIVAAKKYQKGILEIYEYNTSQLENPVDSASGFRQYWLHFFNDELQEWGTKRNYSPREYDHYYEKYRRRH